MIKKLFTAATGYWIYKLKTLPVGTDLFVDIRRRLNIHSLNTVFDVGANEGQTLNYFKLKSPASMVYCFEPVSSSFKKLASRASSFSGGVKLEQIAFGETPGKKTIRLFDDLSVLNSLKDELMNKDINALSENITINTIDEYCNENNIETIDLLKIDTEGYELNVLKGAAQMLASSSIKLVYCEVGFMKQNKRNTYFGDLAEYLAAMDYNFFAVYQQDVHNWENGNALCNALFVSKK